MGGQGGGGVGPIVYISISLMAQTASVICTNVYCGYVRSSEKKKCHNWLYWDEWGHVLIASIMSTVAVFVWKTLCGRWIFKHTHTHCDMDIYFCCYHQSYCFLFLFLPELPLLLSICSFSCLIRGPRVTAAPKSEGRRYSQLNRWVCTLRGNGSWLCTFSNFCDWLLVSSIVVWISSHHHLLLFNPPVF